MKKSVIIIILVVLVLAIVGIVIAVVNNKPVEKPSDTPLNNEIDTKIHGTIMEINDDYLVIICTKTTPAVNEDDIAHVLLTNDPIIQVSFNLIVGQQIEVEPTNILESYPIQIYTDEIVISAE